MKNHPSVKVVFYSVKDNSTKLQFICNKAKEAFQHEKRLLIVVSNLEAAKYVDALLWRFPDDGFIPHVISDVATNEWITITTQEKQNVNQATCLLNLRQAPCSLYHQFEDIYEFYDETHPQKIEFSQKRIQFYQKEGLLVMDPK